MIRSVSHTKFVHAGDTAVITGELIPKADSIGNFSIETANPDGFWGTAIMQLPKERTLPKIMVTPTYTGIVHSKEPKKIIRFKCEYGTWIRVVQYLSRDQVPSVSAKISVETTFADKWSRFWRRTKAKPPKEREY